MNHFQKYLVDEFLEDYTEGRLSRREALKLIGGVIGSLTMASTLLAACAPAPNTTAQASPTTSAGGQTQSTDTAAPPTDVPTGTPAPASTATSAATSTSGATTTSATTSPSSSTGTPQAGATPGGEINIPETDPAIKAGMAEFPSGDAKVMGYLARPSSDGQYPAVLVCHENRGLTDYIKDVARRLAKAGYVALAVDLLSRQGGTAAITDASQVPGLLGQTPTDQFVQDFTAGWTYLKGQPFVRPNGVGMVGFCFGGGVTWLVASKLADLKAAVPFYGPLPPVQDVSGVQAAVLGIYGGLDQRVNAGIPPVEAAMKQNGKTFEKIIYPGADHAFHNDTGTRYNPTAARDAWDHTLAWFAKYLGTA